jgi:hypothetical protein
MTKPERLTAFGLFFGGCLAGQSPGFRPGG